VHPSTTGQPLATSHWPLATGHCRIIALSASALDHEREEPIKAGCDDFVPKPYKDEWIFEKLEAHLGARFVYEEAPAAGSEREEARAAAALAEVLLMPSDLLARLEEVATRGSVRDAYALLEQIRTHAPRLAGELVAVWLAKSPSLRRLARVLVVTPSSCVARWWVGAS
jgi:CheY-like chemotaxis protein